jgi:AraC-like DNA-binding protein
MTGLRQRDERQKQPRGTHVANSAGSYYYLPVGDGIRSWDFYVTSVGSQTYLAGDVYPKSGHPSLYDFDWRKGRTLPEYAVVLITEGKGEYEFRNLPLSTCSAEDALLIAPGQWHRYHPLPRTGWTELWMCAGGEYLHRLRNRKLVFTKSSVSLGTRFGDARRALLELLAAVGRNPNHNGPLFTAKALEIIALIAEVSTEPISASEKYEVNDPDVSNAIEFIWNNSHRPIRIHDVAMSVSLQARTLERRFAACHCRGVREEIEWSRYFRARHLLRDTRLPIKEIAYSCGFGDPRRMIEVFRRRESCSPNEVRTNAPNAD